MSAKQTLSIKRYISGIFLINLRHIRKPIVFNSNRINFTNHLKKDNDRNSI